MPTHRPADTRPTGALALLAAVVTGFLVAASGQQPIRAAGPTLAVSWQGLVGAGAHVAGKIRRCVVWPGGYVGPDEYLTDAIRYGRSGTVTG